MGKLIVIEGTDGSGKSTQFARLCGRLEAEGVGFTRLVFPQYTQPSSALLKMYLAGEFGSRPEDVNAYAASSFYAVDRFASYKKVWQRPYEEGGLVLADRYTSSNAVHQAGKLGNSERREYFDWLYDYEFRLLGLPRPDLVILLDMPTDIAARLIAEREAETGAKKDIHELDIAYLSRCREIAGEAADYYGWSVISCAEDGEIRSVEEVHEEIYASVQKLL